MPRPAIQGQRLRQRILLRAPPRHRPCAHATIADAASSSVRVIVCVGFLVARLRRGPLLSNPPRPLQTPLLLLFRRRAALQIVVVRSDRDEAALASYR